MGMPIAASLGGMGTIIGSPPNAIAVEAINNSGALPFTIGFLEWMLVGAALGYCADVCVMAGIAQAL
ncbi:MAG: hypothetical protein R2795_09590 [Saprospiraceae bacterium]